MSFAKSSVDIFERMVLTTLEVNDQILLPFKLNQVKITFALFMLSLFNRGLYFTIRLRGRVFYERVANEVQTSCRPDQKLIMIETMPVESSAREIVHHQRRELIRLLADFVQRTLSFI